MKGFQILKDRHGKMRCYHRNTGKPIDLVANPLGTVAFFAACKKIEDEMQAELTREPQRSTLAALIAYYFAACAGAIPFRASPVRAANVRGLRHRGDNATLIVVEDLSSGRVDIPGHEVKNGQHIDSPCDDDAMPILAWYMKEIRPRLITAHPYGHHLRDSDQLFPSTGSGAMEETTFAKHYARGCEAIGVNMTLHQARHVSAYYILDADPNAWTEAAAVLGISISTTKDYYAWMDKRKANEEGRRILREARQKARKHKRGTGLHAIELRLRSALVGGTCGGRTGGGARRPAEEA